MVDDTSSNHEIHQPSGCVQTIEGCPEGRPCPKTIEAQLRLCLDAEARGSPNGLGLLGHGFWYRRTLCQDTGYTNVYHISPSTGGGPATWPLSSPDEIYGGCC